MASATILGGAALSGISLGGFVLSGCGGSGGGRDSGTKVKTTSTRVPVVLPPGFSIPLSELEGGTFFSTGALDATGFTTKVVQNAPTFSYIRHKKSGKFVLFGLVGAGRPGITPLATAALAVALAMGITGLAPVNVAEALTLLENDANVKALGDTIAAAMATDPYAMTNGNATVAAAIKVAVDAVRGGGSRQAASSTATRDRGGDAIVLVQPSEQQGGASIEQGKGSTEIVPTNYKRRPCAAYTYLVGHTPGAGASSSEPAQKIDQQDLMPTTSILGSLASLGSRAAFAPVSGKPVSLSAIGQDEKTHYETVILMASGDNGGDPAFYGEARYVGEVAAWRVKRGELNRYALISGILADIFNSVVGGSVAGLSFAAASAIAAHIEAASAAVGAQIIAAATAGEFGTGVTTVLSAIVGDAILSLKYRAVVLELLGFAEFFAAEAAAGLQGIAILGIATLALGTLAAAGTVLAATDLGATYFDAVASPFGERWKETVLNPGVKISPRMADVRKGQRFDLTADVTGAPDGDYEFHWTLAGGSLGFLSGGGKTGPDVTTTTGSVTFVTTPSTQGTFTVTVEAKEKKTGKVLGQDKATLKMVENEPVVQNGVFSVHTSTPSDDPDRRGVDAIVTFSEVPGATRYFIHGEGSNDPDYYGTTINLDYRGPYVDRSGAAFPFVQGLAGGTGPADSAAGFQTYYQNRFGGFHFTVTAYFQ